MLVRPSHVRCLQIGMLFRPLARMRVRFPDESLLVGPLFLATFTAMLPTKCIIYRGLVVVILVPEERSRRYREDSIRELVSVTIYTC